MLPVDPDDTNDPPDGLVLVRETSSGGYRDGAAPRISVELQRRPYEPVFGQTFGAVCMFFVAVAQTVQVLTGRFPNTTSFALGVFSILATGGVSTLLTFFAIRAVRDRVTLVLDESCARCVAGPIFRKIYGPVRFDELLAVWIRAEASSSNPEKDGVWTLWVRVSDGSVRRVLLVPFIGTLEQAEFLRGLLTSRGVPLAPTTHV